MDLEVKLFVPRRVVCRAGRKDPGKHVEDLEKARWYLDREIERVEKS